MARRARSAGFGVSRDGAQREACGEHRGRAAGCCCVGSAARGRLRGEGRPYGCHRRPGVSAEPRADLQPADPPVLSRHARGGCGAHCHGRRAPLQQVWRERRAVVRRGARAWRLHGRQRRGARHRQRVTPGRAQGRPDDRRARLWRRRRLPAREPRTPRRDCGARRRPLGVSARHAAAPRVFPDAQPHHQRPSRRSKRGATFLPSPGASTRRRASAATGSSSRVRSSSRARRTCSSSTASSQRRRSGRSCRP